MPLHIIQTQRDRRKFPIKNNQKKKPQRINVYRSLKTFSNCRYVRTYGRKLNFVWERKKKKAPRNLQKHKQSLWRSPFSFRRRGADVIFQNSAIYFIWTAHADVSNNISCWDAEIYCTISNRILDLNFQLSEEIVLWCDFAWVFFCILFLWRTNEWIKFLLNAVVVV